MPYSSRCSSSFNDSYLFTRPVSIFGTFLWLPLLLVPSLFGLSEGYLVGRLLSLQNVADAHRQLLVATASGDHRALMAPPLSIGNVLAISPAEDFDTLGDKGTTVLGDDEKKGYTSDAANTNTNDDGLVVFTKKSMGEGGRQKHSNGVGSRNCFFTPIQCMIQHDMGKYKKLVDSDIRFQLAG